MLGGEMQEVRIGDGEGDSFLGWLQPAAAPGPGILLLQEIFGVNAQIRSLARQFANRGFPTFAPDLFWRSRPRTDLGYSDADRAMALSLYRDFDVQAGVRDVGMAFDALKSHPSCDGRVAIVGYCLGGLLAVLAAAQHEPDAVVAYYGVGIEQHLQKFSHISCPALLHFGDEDSHVPAHALADIVSAADAMSNVRVAVYEGAGHAFANEQRDDLYCRDSALLADEASVRLLRKVFA
jgi:carboxymethylenebutenolidase